MPRPSVDPDSLCYCAVTRDDVAACRLFRETFVKKWPGTISPRASPPDSSRVVRVSRFGIR
eukprot:31385-Pelagococcus_subviridis.AAC.14